MGSPFPGMDPFVESQKWGGFHHVFISQLARDLVKVLRPRYDVKPEERIYIETTGDPDWYRADIAITVSRSPPAPPTGPAAAVLDLEPTLNALPMPFEVREPYLVIRKTGEREVVAVIELLSPTNKRVGSDGRDEFLKKRHQVLRSAAHLIEIDLLLGGQRLPTVRPLASETDYCAIVSRARRRPKADVFEWRLRQKLPRIPIPLADNDDDALLNLQSAFTAVYEDLGYDYSINYDEPLKVGLPAAEQAWVREIAAARRPAEPR